MRLRTRLVAPIVVAAVVGGAGKAPATDSS